VYVLVCYLLVTIRGLVVSIGTRLFFFTWRDQRVERTGEVNCCALPSNSMTQTCCGGADREDNTSGDLSRRSIPDLQRLLFCCRYVVVFHNDWINCIFITVCSHSFSTDFIYCGFRVQFLSNTLLPFFHRLVTCGLKCVSSFSSLGGCSLSQF
jgi:hypothetical protein